MLKEKNTRGGCECADVSKWFRLRLFRNSEHIKNSARAVIIKATR